MSDAAVGHTAVTGTIRSVEAIPLYEPEWRGGRDWWCTSPMDVFLPDFDRRAIPPTDRVTNVLVRVRTEEGVEGVGLVGIGSPAAVAVVEQHLAPQVVGRSAFDVELLWDRMFRSTVNIGRKGLVIEAISAVDIALWDIKGKLVGRPVYDLLGGRVRSRIRAYVSQSYALDDLGRVRDEAAGYVAQGFSALKMRFGYGPVDGRAGMRANRALVETVRGAIGPDVELMADAYMGWDARYAIEMIRRLEDLDLSWVEEPVMPDDLDGYQRIRAAVRTPIAGGEHESTRWGFRDLIARGAVDILQPDVNRMGGITEARKVWALASAHGLPVIPHSAQAHNAHLIVSHLDSPLIEWFPDDTLRCGYLIHQELFIGEPRAVDGYVEVSDRPGLGIEVDADVLAALRADGRSDA
ncbi:MAG: L-rhamnonate dehydratase [Chloroflexi bacterium]|nr:L-rhamnonate dehydratase [Chloroflexota bacterium]